LKIIGLNSDSDPKTALDAIQNNKLGYRHVGHGQNMKTGVYNDYRVTGLPSTFLLDKDLRIIAAGLAGAKLEEEIKKRMDGK
jgi:hypothetical protein